MTRLLDRHRRTAERFAERIVRDFAPDVHAVILYGSVARGTPRQDSDVDLLVLSEDPAQLHPPVSHLEFEVNLSNGYRNLLSCHHSTVPHFKWLLEIGSPFAEDVRDQGIVLYDDGSYERVRQTLPVEG